METKRSRSRISLHNFRYASHGILYSYRTQRNFRLQLIIGAAVILAGIIFRVSLIEWALLAFAISGVLVSEVFNTAVEFLVDLVEQKNHCNAMLAKDIAAGAVLLAAINSVVIGIIVFLF